MPFGLQLFTSAEEKLAVMFAGGINDSEYIHDQKVRERAFRQIEMCLQTQT